MGVGVMTAQDQRMAFVYSKDVFSMGVAKLKMFFYERGAYRHDKRDRMSLHTLKEYLRHQIDTYGWQRLGSIYGSGATSGYLGYLGFKGVVIDQDAGTFSCGVTLFGQTLDRETYDLPVWLQFFLDLETKTNRGGLSNQALLSTWDSAKLLYEHWLARNNMIASHQIVEGAITAERLAFNQGVDDRILARYPSFKAERQYAAEDGIT